MNELQTEICVRILYDEEQVKENMKLTSNPSDRTRDELPKSFHRRCWVLNPYGTNDSLLQEFTHHLFQIGYEKSIRHQSLELRPI